MAHWRRQLLLLLLLQLQLQPLLLRRSAHAAMSRPGARHQSLMQIGGGGWGVGRGVGVKLVVARKETLLNVSH